jgi:hypothetical protein
MDLGLPSNSLIFYTDGRTPWTGDQPVARPKPTHTGQHKHRINAHTSMPQMGFEPTIPAFERPKTVHALDRAVTMIDESYIGYSFQSTYFFM